MTLSFKIAVVDFSKGEYNRSLEKSTYYRMIGVDISVMNLSQNVEETKLQIWSLSPHFTLLHKIFSLGLVGAVVIFDHLDRNSFTSCLEYIEKLDLSKEPEIYLLGLNSHYNEEQAEISTKEVLNTLSSHFSTREEISLTIHYIPILSGELTDLTEYYLQIARITIQKLYFKSIDDYETQSWEVNKVSSSSSLFLESDLVSVSCFLDRQKATRATTDGWARCMICDIYICPTCLAELKSQNYPFCPGSMFAGRHFIKLTIYSSE